MHDIEEITAEIVWREGGFVNDPDDPGGATKYGVTIHTLSALRGSATVADVKALTEAVAIFKGQYFERPKINQLSAPLQASVHDMQVNAGANAIKILQRLTAEFGVKLAVDGVLSPKSIGAIDRIHRKAGAQFVDAYGIARRNYYFRIGDLRPASRKYCVTRKGGKGGWITRAEEFIRARYHLSQEDFEKRIATWA
jgi:lysozyme family protein